MPFIKASKIETQSSLMIAIAGPSGTGKTIAAMLIAKGLGGKTAIANTEKHGPLTYRDRVDLGLGNFDFLYQKILPPFTPEAFMEMINQAKTSGCTNLIFDSFSHEWIGSGGVLELVDTVKKKFQGNAWSAWSELTPRHRKLIDSMDQSEINIICTLRSKTETTQETVNGKTKIIKLGMKAEQRDGIEYDFTVYIDMQEDFTAFMTNDRTGVLSSIIPEKITEETGQRLKLWQERKLQLSDHTIPEPQYNHEQANQVPCNIDLIIKPFNDKLKSLKNKNDFIKYYVSEFNGSEYKNEPVIANTVWGLIKNTAEGFGLIYSKPLNSWVEIKPQQGGIQ